MFKAEFHSLHWNNVAPEMLAAHKRVMEHYQFPMQYHNIDGANHGKWMEWVINNSASDILVFIEPDCIPLNREKVIEYINYAGTNETFVGNAQVANHIPTKSHIYAAPSFYVISKKFYDRAGKPTLAETRRGDVGEEICYIAEAMNVPYRALMPTCYEKESTEGIWQLGNLGYYGTGTVYDNTIYHLFQSRYAANVELFVKRCEELLNGTFTTKDFHSSTALTPPSPVAKYY
jgi:hypothetical protein